MTQIIGIDLSRPVDTFAQIFNPLLIYIEAKDPRACPRKRDSHRQSNISQTNDSYDLVHAAPRLLSISSRVARSNSQT
jgi:hypothetical protein